MKALLTYISIFFCLWTYGSSNSVQQADSAYQAHNYELAIKIYSEIIATHQHSAALYFNLGNAYYKNNELGKAIWAYHKAKKINPKQKDIAFNLNFVSQLTKDKIEQNETGVTKWMANVFFGRSINFWAYVSFIVLLIATFFFYLFKITQSKNKRGIFLISSFSFGFLFLLCFSIAMAHKSHITNLSHGIIIDPVVKVRTAPNTEDAVAFELHEGAKFTYKQTQGEWQRIEVGNNEGWILKDKALLY
ncbi:MAG: hypothetical protein R3279_02800 [Putridiphycobacter sp.]|nr:hypothetical protein [Putridiphycobacter sp.]